jgi:uncharacterized protein YcfJ
MKKLLIALIFIVFLSVGCANNRQGGAAIGAATGGAIGALAYDSNSWLGLAIGATAGALVGYIAGDAMDQKQEAQQQAVTQNRKVVIYDDQQRAVEAQPVGQRYGYMDQSGRMVQTNCRKVRTRIWEGDKVVSDKTEEVCEGEKKDRTY